MLLISKNLTQLELVSKLLDCQKDLFSRIIFKKVIVFGLNDHVNYDWKGFYFEQNRDVNVEIEAIAVIGPFKEA